jgi:hypothetical protein
MPNASDYIDLKVINSEDLRKLFTELQPAVQNRIVLTGMRQAANVILKQARSNFKAVQKGKSTTGYKYVNKAFSTEPMKGTFGLKVGVKNYKLRWVQWGTEDRFYKKGRKRFFRYRKSLINKDDTKHFTGRVQPTNFFYGAVEQKAGEAQKMISSAILQSLEKTVKKYNANT